MTTQTMKLERDDVYGRAAWLAHGRSILDMRPVEYLPRPGGYNEKGVITETGDRPALFGLIKADAAFLAAENNRVHGNLSWMAYCIAGSAYDAGIPAAVQTALRCKNIRIGGYTATADDFAKVVAAEPPMRITIINPLLLEEVAFDVADGKRLPNRVVSTIVCTHKFPQEHRAALVGKAGGIFVQTPFDQKTRVWYRDELDDLLASPTAAAVTTTTAATRAPIYTGGSRIPGPAKQPSPIYSPTDLAEMYGVGKPAGPPAAPPAPAKQPPVISPPMDFDEMFGVREPAGAGGGPAGPGARNLAAPPAPARISGIEAMFPAGRSNVAEKPVVSSGATPPFSWYVPPLRQSPPQLVPAPTQPLPQPAPVVTQLPPKSAPAPTYQEVSNARLSEIEAMFVQSKPTPAPPLAPVVAQPSAAAAAAPAPAATASTTTTTTTAPISPLRGPKIISPAALKEALDAGVITKEAADQLAGFVAADDDGTAKMT